MDHLPSCVPPSPNAFVANLPPEVLFPSGGYPTSLEASQPMRRQPSSQQLKHIGPQKQALSSQNVSSQKDSIQLQKYDMGSAFRDGQYHQAVSSDFIELFDYNFLYDPHFTTGSHLLTSPPGLAVTQFYERPPVPPPPQQARDFKEASIEDRINAFGPDVRKLIKTYGGWPEPNTYKVLEKAEEWLTRQPHVPLFVVHRKENAKGGVDYVTCNVCLHGDRPIGDSRFRTIQKVAEHITSFHWELSIWNCSVNNCTHRFRRKQECDRHEEATHGIVTKKKEAKKLKKVCQSNVCHTIGRAAVASAPERAPAVFCSRQHALDARHDEPKIKGADILRPPLARGLAGSRSSPSIRSEPYNAVDARRTVRRAVSDLSPGVTSRPPPHTVKQQWDDPSMAVLSCSADQASTSHMPIPNIMITDPNASATYPETGLGSFTNPNLDLYSSLQDASTQGAVSSHHCGSLDASASIHVPSRYRRQDSPLDSTNAVDNSHQNSSKSSPTSLPPPDAREDTSCLVPEEPLDWTWVEELIAGGCDGMAHDLYTQTTHKD